MRVLVVEDEELILEFLKRSLKADKKDVDVATNGADGYKKAMLHSYDAIVLDVMMPIKNGLDVCRDLRREGNVTPIIFLSSRGSESARVQGLDAGADDYMAKPFSYKELNARLRAITRRPSTSLGAKLVVGDVVLDSARHIATRGKRNLVLRPKEFALLEYLMQNPGTVLTREQLLRKIWGVSQENSSNRLEVYVRHLRTKLTLADEDQMIYTVRGKGYKIMGGQ